MAEIAERHDPLPNATCRAERNHGHMDDATHVCRWLLHADTTHSCKCGYMWDSGEPTFDERVRAGFAPALVQALKGQEVDGELIRLRNRITALEANGAELLARAERAERLSALCSCGSTYETYQGPEVDCAVHGAVRAYNEAQATIERVRELRDQWALASASPDDSPTSRLRMQLYADVVAWLDAALSAPESNAPAPSPVSAATEAHGETGGAEDA